MPKTNQAAAFPSSEQKDAQNNGAKHPAADFLAPAANISETPEATASMAEQQNDNQGYGSWSELNGDENCDDDGSEFNGFSDEQENETTVNSDDHEDDFNDSTDFKNSTNLTKYHAGTRIKASHIGEAVAHSPFFRLSPELRNKIYRLMLLEEDHVMITKRQGIPEPASLSACKILRSEALGIFYLENKFMCLVNKFDPAPFLLVARKLDAHKSLLGKEGLDMFRCQLDEGRSWANILWWLREYYFGRCGGLGTRTDDDAERSLLISLFGMAVLCNKYSEREWEKLKQNAELVRPALVEFSARWAAD